MLIPSCRARSSSRSGVPAVSSPMMIASRRRSSAASAIVRWRTAASAGTGVLAANEADPEPHLIRCQTRERMRAVRDGGRGTSRAKRGEVMTRIARARVALVVVATAALVLAATAAARIDAGASIVIGWALDSKGAMAPFDGPALAAAQVRVKQLDARGGVGGRPLQIKTCDTQNNKPAIAKAYAQKLLSQG